MTQRDMRTASGTTKSASSRPPPQVFCTPKLASEFFLVYNAQRLEDGTKHYGVCILMTNAFFDLLPPTVQKLCRCIDRVKEEGNRMPMELYTYDFRYVHICAHACVRMSRCRSSSQLHYWTGGRVIVADVEVSN